MKIWQQANPVMPKTPSDKPAKHNNKINNIVTTPKALDTQARETTGRLITVTEKTRSNETGVAESMKGSVETSREGQAAQGLWSTSEGWKSKTEEVLAALRRQEEERKLEVELFEIECIKKREKWDAEWRRMFDSFREQDSDSEKPRVTSATASRREALVNGIVVSSAAVVQDHLDSVDEAASMSARAIHCQEPGDCKESGKRVSGNGSVEERTVLSKPGQREVATSSECFTGAVCSAAVLGARSQGGWSASWSSGEEISRSVVSGSSGMTAVDCTLGSSLSEETDGNVFQQTYEINQDDVVCVAEETCVGVPEGCQDVFEMEEESRANTQECRRCEGIYELNEELMRERCTGILEDKCERVSLEEVVMEELIFFDDEDESDEVSGGVLGSSETENSGSSNGSPAGVIGSSVLAEKNDGDRVVEGSIVFDPGENSTWTSGTGVDSDHLGLADVDGTVLAVGDAYGEELASSMEQDQTSVGGLLGEISEVESVDPPWASTVGEIAVVSQVLTCSGTSGIEGNVCPKSGIETVRMIGASALGQHFFPME